MNLGNVACNDNEVGRQQCDQMAILFVQYLEISSSKIWKTAKIRCLSRFKTLPITKKPKCQSWVKFSNLTKSGHTGRQVPFQKNLHFYIIINLAQCRLRKKRGVK